MTHTLKRILIVDDDAIIRQTLRLLLRESGFEVVGEAHDGLRAMSLINKHKPGIVMLDINMPGASGLDVLTDIHSGYPNIEVIMISGSAQAEDVKTAVERGAAGYIVKPFNVKNVVQNVTRAIQLAVKKKQSTPAQDEAPQKAANE